MGVMGLLWGLVGVMYFFKGYVSGFPEVRSGLVAPGPAPGAGRRDPPSAGDHEGPPAGDAAARCRCASLWKDLIQTSRVNTREILLMTALGPDTYFSGVVYMRGTQLETAQSSNRAKVQIRSAAGAPH